jgi:N-acetylneuraminic acid mutarotase
MKEMKTKSKTSGYTIRSTAWAVFLSVALFALGSAFSSLNRVARTSTPPRALSFAERVAYQRAIEDVYWRHRIWPKENPYPKPSLDAVISHVQLENKVASYLRESLVLDDYWHRPITAEQLQAEMDRMIRDTKQREVLRELFEALGNDPTVIAECLARPILAERLIGDLSVQNATQRFESPRTDKLHAMSLVTTNGHVAYTLPRIADPDGPPCIDNPWTPTSTANAPNGRDGHTAVWTGSEMIVWGGCCSFTNTGGRYNPSTDSWTATSTINAPSGRVRHTAVWTGSEMIVWGGAFVGDVNTGGRYDPSTNSWTTTSTTNAPSARDNHTAVWTGSEMIIWGGAGTNTGGRYNPSTNSWTATSTTNAPINRSIHTAVWTGSEMIVWGGYGGSYLNTGGRYDPSTNSWATTSATNAPTVRGRHTAVWTGSEMIVWGGEDCCVFLNTGGRYNPSTNSWTAASTTNAPEPRFLLTAVWTGTKMIVWGGVGENGFDLNTGGRYDPMTDSWESTSTTNAPERRDGHTAVWTGSEMIVWGGETLFLCPPGVCRNYLNTGASYCAQGCSVTSTACGSIVVGAAPTDFTVNLSDPADSATVQASDFTVNGTPADNDMISNGDLTITFHFNASPVVGGQNTMHIPAGAFNCGQGPVQEFTCTFFYRVLGATPLPRARPTPHPRPIPQ